MLIFFFKKKNKKKIKTPGDIIFKGLMILFSSHILKLVTLGYFLPFYPSKKPTKLKFGENEKRPWIYYHFTYVCQKLQSDDVRFLRYGV